MHRVRVTSYSFHENVSLECTTTRLLSCHVSANFCLNFLGSKANLKEEVYLNTFQ